MREEDMIEEGMIREGQMNHEDQSIELQVLARAHRLIAVFGWVQGGYGDELTGYCVRGALDAAGYGMELATAESVRRSGALLCKLVAEMGFEDVTDWNDELGRTKQEVLDLLDRAVER